MTVDKVLITISGLLLIVLTYWYFLGKKEKDIDAQGKIDILVKGGYQPSRIVASVGKPLIINFLRKDESTCLEEVVLSDFKIRKFLPLNQTLSVTVSLTKKGEFDFSCGMGMFHGKLIVK